VQHTNLFGPGGVGKGVLASHWVTKMTIAGRTVIVLDYEGNGGEWARRIEGLGGDLSRVVYVAPLKAGLGAIWDHAEAIHYLVEANPGAYVVIDSAVMACAGADPMDPETPTRYYAALQTIGAPSLTLAHVTKLHDTRYPFGSVFWHNLARVTWSLMPKGEEVLLTCQKANNWLKPPAATVEMTWKDGVLREVREQRAIVRLTDRIIDLLADGPMTAAAIAEALNDGVAKEEHTRVGSVRTALSRELGGARRVEKVGDQWRKVSEDD
jgi:hypothetical protein